MPSVGPCRPEGVLGRLEEIREDLAVLQARAPFGDIGDRNLAGHDDAQRIELGLERGFVERLVLGDDFVEAGVWLRTGRQRQANRALRIGIDEERFPSALGAGERKINGAGGLAHAPFQTRDG